MEDSPSNSGKRSNENWRGNVAIANEKWNVFSLKIEKRPKLVEERRSGKYALATKVQVKLFPNTRLPEKVIGWGEMEVLKLRIKRSTLSVLQVSRDAPNDGSEYAASC